MLTNMDLVLAKEKLDKSKLFWGGEETDVHLQVEIDAVLLSVYVLIPLTQMYCLCSGNRYQP